MLRPANGVFTKFSPSLNQVPVTGAAGPHLPLGGRVCWHGAMNGRLGEALRRYRRPSEGDEKPSARVSAAEFRAAAEERLRALEREVAEVKGRVNGLIFVVAGAVITQVVLRLVG